MNIKKVLGYQVLDSRGRPTVAVTLTLSDGSMHTARVHQVLQLALTRLTSCVMQELQRRKTSTQVNLFTQRLKI